MSVGLRLATAVATIAVLLAGVLPAGARPVKNGRDRHARTVRCNYSRIDPGDVSHDLQTDAASASHDARSIPARTCASSIVNSPSANDAIAPDAVAVVAIAAAQWPVPASCVPAIPAPRSAYRYTPLHPRSGRAPPARQ